MKLEPPISNLVNRCQTICVSECCGIDAYDFSPIHIASYLLMWEGRPNSTEITRIRNQLEALKANYGTSGAIAPGVTFEDLNQIFSANEIDSLVDEILANLDVALQLIAESETKRFHRRTDSSASC
jgi:hypothetical protein